MDLTLLWGGDLTVSPTGDLALSDVPDVTQQRVLRRLLTNAGDYIWQIPYGAGLAQFVGQPVGGLQVAAVIRSQIFQEAAIAPIPEPTVTVLPGPAATLAVSLVYTDAQSATPQVLSFNVGA